MSVPDEAHSRKCGAH